MSAATVSKAVEIDLSCSSVPLLREPEVLQLRERIRNSESMRCHVTVEGTVLVPG
jgi:hypothetical protein